MKEPIETSYQYSIRAPWLYSDVVRRQQGHWMDRLGFGPEPTPSRVVHCHTGVQLLAYQQPNAQQPVLLIVPAPIKTPYIWDLAPESSVVQRCLGAGVQVYLMEWQRPQPGDEQMGLAEYADSLIAQCLRAIARETGQSKVFLAGHSLGGTFAAIFASLHTARLHGLIELEGPILFGPEVGKLESTVVKSPPGRALGDAFGNVPGSFLNIASSWADFATFNQEPWIDRLRTWSSPRARRAHWRVRRWTLDEMPLPQRLFEEIVDGLYRGNRFACGTLQVDGRVADPHAITTPILAVSDPRSRVVPAKSVEAYHYLTESRDVQILQYQGDVGVMLQHVGVLVGENAHKSLWPLVLAWMHQHFSPEPAA